MIHDVEPRETLMTDADRITRDWMRKTTRELDELWTRLIVVEKSLPDSTPPTPAPAGDDAVRWKELADEIGDCFENTHSIIDPSTHMRAARAAVAKAIELGLVVREYSRVPAGDDMDRKPHWSDGGQEG